MALKSCQTCQARFLALICTHCCDALLCRAVCVPQANPSVPVIENLEDLWKVDVLQKARARRAAAAAVAAAAAAAAGTAAAKAATAAAAAAPDGSLSVGPAGPV